MRKPFPVGIVIAAGLVLTAFFLPWGTAAIPWKHANASIGGQRLDAEGAKALYQLFTGKVPGPWYPAPLEPWSADWSFSGLKLPGWLVLGCALWILGLKLLDIVPRVRIPSWIPILFCAYAIAHLAYDWRYMVPYGSPGLGLIMASAACVWMAVTLMREAIASPRTHSPEEAAEGLPRPSYTVPGRPIPR